MMIKPGEFGDFKVQVDNRGSVPANMDNFTRTLSNRPNQSSPFTFVINRNTDFDCTGGGVSYRVIRMTASQMIASPPMERCWQVALRRSMKIRQAQEPVR